jgi:hypothetical protein
MTQKNATPPKAKPEPEPELPPDPYPPYRPVYSWVFQAWIVTFLAVICFALIFYLYPHVRGLFG